MNINQNPFSLYDFLGYFIPGALLLYILNCIDWSGSILSLINSIKLKLGNENYLPFVISAYITGHLLSFISSITIEKFSIWLYGYPSKYLLDIKTKPFYNSNLSIPDILKRTLIGIFVLPIAFYDILLDKLLQLKILHGRSLDKNVIDLIFDNANKAYENMLVKKSALNIDIKNDDFFTILYHYVLERNKNHSTKIQNYVALYGLLRCITLIFVILFWTIILLHFWIPITKLEYFILITFVSFTSYIFFLSFKKFYRRFSLETLLALTSMQH